MQKVRIKKIMNKPYFRLLVSYIIILAIIITFFTINYYRIAKSIKEQKISETLISLQRTSSTIDEQIDKIRQLLYNISLNEEIRRIASINTSLLPYQYQWLLDAHSVIDKYELSGGIIDECIIVFNPEIPFMLTTQHIVTNPYNYYTSGLFKYNGINYNKFRELLISFQKTDWKQLYFLPSMSTNIYGKGTINYITLVLPLHIAGAKKSPIALIFINPESIKNLHFPFLSNNGSWFCIIDSKGNILYNENYKGQHLPKPSHTAKVFASVNDSVMYVTSSTTNLTYYVSISADWIKNQMKPFWTAFYFALIISFITSIVLSVFFAYYNIKPVSRIINNISRRFSAIDESNGSYDYIEKSFDFIMTSNKQMMEKLERWSPIIKTGLYERVFKDGIISDHEYSLIPDIKLYVSGGFRVAVIGWKAYPSKKIKHSVQQIISSISSLIGEYFELYIIHPLDDEKAAVLLCKDEYNNIDQILNKLTEINNQLSNIFDLLFAIGIGGEYNETSLISVSCFEAKRALAGIKDWHDSRVMSYDCFTRNINKYDFSFEHMEKICNYVLAGDKKSLQIIIDQIYNKNFCDKIYDDNHIEQFYNDLMRILNKVSCELPISDILKSISGLSSFSNVHEIMSYFLVIFKKAADISIKQKTDASKELIKQIIDYIEINYNNPNMSLQNLAIKFGMSEKYLSLFIKEKAGTKFSSILENKRLSKATDLMRETDMSIKEIHELVGYTSTNTFYKAFRRKYGMSPTEWRKDNVKATNISGI